MLSFSKHPAASSCPPPFAILLASLPMLNSQSFDLLKHTVLDSLLIRIIKSAPCSSNALSEISLGAKEKNPPNTVYSLPDTGILPIYKGSVSNYLFILFSTNRKVFLWY